jgi:poly(A) polymerase
VVADGVPAPERDGAAHHDNTFGTPEEDAFRRDFTINALFYDIATFSIIDYVNGMEDLHAGIVRSIGDPEVRFKEDPVRMLRAVALAARLSFTIDPPILEAIRLHRHEIARSSPARLLEEYYKILRSGYAERIFRGLAEAGLLEPISSELHQSAGEALWRSLAALDTYRARFAGAPESLTNPVLLGSLLVPGGFTPRTHVREAAAGAGKPPGPRLGELPLARRDVERLSQILQLQRRLRDVNTNPRAQSALAHRSIFREALTWLDVHGEGPALVAHWTAVADQRGAAPAADPERVGQHGAEGSGDRPVRRRRRRRRRYRPAPS